MGTEKTNSRAILLVGESGSSLDFLSGKLSAEGFRLSVAREHDDVLSMLKAVPPELVILDVLLFPSRAAHILSLIRRNSSAPVIVLAAPYEAKHLSLSAKEETADVLRKPFPVENLLSKIAEILASSRSRHSHGKTGTA